MENQQQSSLSMPSRIVPPRSSTPKNAGRYTNSYQECHQRSGIPRLSMKTDDKMKVNPTSIRSKSCDESAFKESLKLMEKKLDGNLRLQETSQQDKDDPKLKLLKNEIGDTTPMKSPIKCERSKSDHSKFPSKSSSPTRSLDTGFRRPHSSSSRLSTNQVCSLPSEDNTIKRNDKKKRTPRLNIVEPSTRSPELLFYKKKRKFDQMKLEFFEKQSHIMEVYNSLLQIKKQIDEVSGNKKLELEQLKIIDYLDKDKQLNINFDIDKMKEMEKRLRETYTMTSSLCRELIESRLQLLDWLSQPSVSRNVTIAKQIDQFRRETEQIQVKRKELCEEETKRISGIVNEWKEIIQWREISKHSKLNEYEENIKALQEINTKLRSDLEKVRNSELETKRKLKEVETHFSELKKHVDETKEKEGVESDSEKCKTTAEKQSMFDGKLKCVKQRFHEAEVKLKLSEQKILELNAKIKKLEENWKNKECMYENRTKDYTKTAKLNDSLIVKMEKDRSGFEMRIKNLEQLLETSEEENRKNMKQLENKLEVTEKQLSDLKAEHEVMQKKYTSARERLIELEVKCQQEEELSKKRKFSVETGDANVVIHTQAELDLWTELQATRVSLKAAEDRLAKKFEEKQRFLQTIENAVAEKDVLTSEGWTARLIQKDEEIEKLNQKIDLLSDTIVFSKDLASRQEKKILDLKKTLDSLMANQEVSYDMQRGDRKELDNMMEDLKEKLDKTMRRCKDFEQKLLIKDHALSAAEKKLKEQENLLKVRDGIIGIMKSKKDMTLSQYDSLREYVNDLMHQYNEVNSKLQAKQEEINELYTSLECKTMQIERLEKTIQTMEHLCKQTNIQIEEMQNKIQYYQKSITEYQMIIAEYKAQNPESRTWTLFPNRS